MINKIFHTTVLIAIAISVYGQKALRPVSNRLVNDFADMLVSAEEDALERKLVEYARSTSTQIAIITENSLEGEDLFDYSFRQAVEWGIGKSDKDNGVLIFIAEEDRKIYIHTGYGVEGFLPDAMASRIIENIIKPNFRVGNYYQGLNEATTVIMDLGRGEYTADEWDQRTSEGGVPTILILLFLIVLIIIISNMNNHDDDDDGGYYRGGRYDMDDWERHQRRKYRRRRGGGWIIIPGGFPGGGGGGFGGLGGGGFGGFGGGGFGGGGAGGSW